MKRYATIAVVMGASMGLALLGCQSKEPEKAETEQVEPEPEKTGLAGQFDRTINDRDVMREAVDAANQVIHNAADCEVAMAALPEAQEKLDAAAEKIKTPAGRASIESLQRSVSRVADACP